MELTLLMVRLGWIAPAVLLLAALGVACSGGDDRGDLRAWAADLCKAAEHVEAALATDDGVDPSTLDLEQRKARSARMTLAVVEGYRAAEETLRSSTPPSSVRRYHEAVARQVTTVREAFEETGNQIQGAASAQEIEEANDRLAGIFRNSGNEANAVSTGLSGDAVEAIRSFEECGAIN